MIHRGEMQAMAHTENHPQPRLLQHRRDMGMLDDGLMHRYKGIYFSATCGDWEQDAIEATSEAISTAALRSTAPAPWPKNATHEENPSSFGP